MVTQVHIVGTKPFLATISKALVVSNLIGVISFLGVSALIVWQYQKSTKPIQEDYTKRNDPA